MTGDPVPDTGAGHLVAPGLDGFALHDHDRNGFIPNPVQAFAIYTFASRVKVTEAVILQHSNGADEIELFSGSISCGISKGKSRNDGKFTGPLISLQEQVLYDYTFETGCPTSTGISVCHFLLHIFVNLDFRVQDSNPLYCMPLWICIVSHVSYRCSRRGCGEICFLAFCVVQMTRAQVLDSSSVSRFQSCATTSPELSLALSYHLDHNSRAVVATFTSRTLAINTRFFVITLAGLAFSFSSNRNITFISPSTIAATAYLNMTSLVMTVEIYSSWNFTQHEPIIFAFGDLEFAQVTAQNTIQSAVFSSDGTCLLQSNLGFSPTFTLFPAHLPKRYMRQCRSADIDKTGFC